MLRAVVPKSGFRPFAAASGPSRDSSLFSAAAAVSSTVYAALGLLST
jgi:hypothetical protein